MQRILKHSLPNAGWHGGAIRSLRSEAKNVKGKEKKEILTPSIRTQVGTAAR
jgi:hypothetical protein